MQISPTAVLAEVLWPVSGRAATLARGALLALVGSALLTLSAKIQVPFWPVPMTMQTYVVLVLAMAFGPRLGVATIGLYLLEGALGLPVFAGTPEKGIGIAYMMGPTGGYLAGFVVSAALVGWLAERGFDRSLPLALLAITLGHAVLLALGVAWLAVLFGWSKAYAVGLAPFWAATVLKTGLATCTMPLAWRLLKGSAR